LTETTIPDIRGNWYYSVEVLKALDGNEMRVENTLETSPTMMNVSQNGHFVLLQLPVDPTRSEAGVLSGVLKKAPGQPWKLHVSDYDDNGIFEYTQTELGWRGVYLEAGNIGSKEQSTTAGIPLLARSVDDLNALKNETDNDVPQIAGEWLYHAELLKKIGGKDIRVGDRETLGPAPVALKQKGRFVSVNALGGLLAGVFHKDADQSWNLYVADHADNGHYRFQSTPYGWEATYIERGEKGSADQTATAGRVLLAKSDSQLQKMIENKGNNVPQLPASLVYEAQVLYAPNETALNNPSKEKQTWNVQQKGRYVTFQNEENKILPGQFRKNGNRWELHIADVASSGLFKLYQNPNGDFDGVYLKSAHDGSTTQSASVWLD
tara:strand:+ start:5929 stop:7065 length:1137 start_codon:yes stop_codon:yes gene_type:complete